MVTVREVETGNVHASVQHFNEIFDIPAGWAKGADNFGLPRVGVDALEDVLEFDATGVSALVLARFYHYFACTCKGVFISKIWQKIYA